MQKGPKPPLLLALAQKEPSAGCTRCTGCWVYGARGVWGAWGAGCAVHGVHRVLEAQGTGCTGTGCRSCWEHGVWAAWCAGCTRCGVVKVVGCTGCFVQRVLGTWGVGCMACWVHGVHGVWGAYSAGCTGCLVQAVLCAQGARRTRCWVCGVLGVRGAGCAGCWMHGELGVQGARYSGCWVCRVLGVWGAGCTGCREHRVREDAEQHGEPLPPRGDTAGRGTAAGRRVTSLCAGGRGTAGPALHRVRSKTVPLRRRSHPRPDTPLSPASPAPGDGSAPRVPGDRSPIAGETRCADSTRALNQHRCSSGARAGTRLPPETPKPPVQRRRSPPTPRVPASG